MKFHPPRALGASAVVHARATRIGSMRASFVIEAVPPCLPEAEAEAEAEARIEAEAGIEAGIESPDCLRSACEHEHATSTSNTRPRRQWATRAQAEVTTRMPNERGEHRRRLTLAYIAKLATHEV